MIGDFDDYPPTHTPEAVRHPDGCESCARPSTEAGRRILAQFHGWPDRPEYPWNLLDANDIIEIERQAATVSPATHDTPEAALAAALRDAMDASEQNPEVWLDYGDMADFLAKTSLAALEGWTLVSRVATADWTGSTRKDAEIARLRSLLTICYDAIDGDLINYSEEQLADLREALAR
jgi:hypothetical protein